VAIRLAAEAHFVVVIGLFLFWREKRAYFTALIALQSRSRCCSELKKWAASIVFEPKIPAQLAL
jgi:hypothetical protein